MCKLRLSPRRIALVLLAIVAGLLAGGLLTQYIKFFHGHDVQFGFLRLLALDGENNLPSWYSSLQLLFSAAALGIIGLYRKQTKDPYRWHWLALSMLFLCLATDEASSIHEMTAPLIERWVGTAGPSIKSVSSLVGTPWLLAAIPFTIIVFLVFVRFLWNLPRATMILFLIGGGVYVAGTVGVEDVAGYYLVNPGADETFTYQIMITVEEGLEMLGIVVFLYGLMAYMATHGISLEVVVSHDEPFAKAIEPESLAERRTPDAVVNLSNATTSAHKTEKG
jgi:hypothetical protein